MLNQNNKNNQTAEASSNPASETTHPKTGNDLAPIPDKRYFTIGEVSHLCEVKPHVLRYWEQEFAQLRPSKRRGNRRYYQHKDVLMVRCIRSLLYDQGYTISGARSQLGAEMRNERAEDANQKQQQTQLEGVIVELESLLEAL